MTNPFGAVSLVVIGILAGLLLAVAAFGAMVAGHAMDGMWEMMGVWGAKTSSAARALPFRNLHTLFSS